MTLCWSTGVSGGFGWVTSVLSTVTGDGFSGYARIDSTGMDSTTMGSVRRGPISPTKCVTGMRFAVGMMLDLSAIAERPFFVAGMAAALSLGERFGVVAIPLLTYAIAVLGHGNGFVAAFVAGILYRLMRTRGTVEHTIPHTEVMLVEEVGTLAANARRSDSSVHAAPRRSCSGCSPSQSCRSPRRTTCSP